MVQYLMASHTHFRQYFSKNKCDRHLTLSNAPVSISNNRSPFFHTTIKMIILQTIQLTPPKIDLNKSILEH